MSDTKKTYLLFGLRSNDLHAARRIIEGALGVQMVLHESDYLGEYYCFGDVGAEHFILQKNYDDVEGEWTEPNFSNYDFLLYVNETDRGADIGAALAPVAEMLTKQEL